MFLRFFLNLPQPFCDYCREILLWERKGVYQKQWFFMKWKRPCVEVFQDPLKLHIPFWRIVDGRFKCEKWADHQKKKLFINNAVETLIPFKEDHQGLMRLHVYLGEDFYCGKNVLRFPEEEFFLKQKNDVRGSIFEPIKILLIFWTFFGGFQCLKGALWKSCVTFHKWRSYENCWIHVGEYLVHAWLHLVTKLQKSTPLVSPHVE